MLKIYSKGEGGKKRQNKVNLFVYKQWEAIKKKTRTFKTRVADAIISLAQESAKQFLTQFFTCVVIR